MDLEDARIRKAVYDFIPKYQRHTRLRVFVVEGARARERGNGKDHCPYLHPQDKQWWKLGWDLMDHALNPETQRRNRT